MAQAYYTPRVIQTGQVPSTQTSFPALVLLNDTRYKTIGNGGHVANANGYDIRFYSDSALTTALTYELVTYSASAGTGEFHVLVSSLADAITIYIGYGDAALNTDGSSPSTWPSQYKMVQHFADGSTLSLNDSTSNANNLTNHSATATSGQIDGAVNFNGSSQYLSRASNSGLSGMSQLAISLWLSGTSFASDPGILNKFGSGGGNSYLTRAGADGKFVFKTTTGGGEVGGSFNGTISTNTLTHIAAVYDGSQMLVYVNGSVSSTTFSQSGTIVSSTQDMNIGTDYDLSDYFPGKLDETRLSNAAPSANWITSEYNNQSNNAAFWPDGTEVAVGGGGSIVPRLDNSYRQRRAA